MSTAIQGVGSLQRVTKAEPDPSRLRVCWIEDRDADFPTDALFDSLGPYFDIWRARGPEDLAAFLREHRGAIQEARWADDRYSLSHAPFDLYISDWDLKEHADNRSRAHTVRAAGLFASALAASEFSQHPAAIVTWTGLRADHAAEEALVKALLVPVVAWAEKQKADVAAIDTPRLGASVVREALVRAAQHGDVYLPSTEVARIQTAASDPDEFRRWLESGHVLFHTCWGWRKIRAASLWADVYEEEDGLQAILPLDDLLRLEAALVGEPRSCVPVGRSIPSLVSAWVARFPVPDASMLRADQHAQFYYTFSKLDRSRVRHRLNKAHAAVKGGDSTARGEMDSLCSKVGIKGEDALAASGNEKAQRALWPEGWSCPSLLKSPLNDEEKRLACCMLYLREVSQRTHLTLRASWNQGPEEDASEDQKELHIARALLPIFLNHLQRCLDSTIPTAQGLDPLLAWLRKQEQPAAREALLAVQTFADVDLWGPVTAEALARMLDPLPELLTPASIAAGKGLGATLGRLAPPLDLYKLVTEGKRDILSARERTALRMFCREIDLPKRAWPQWLS